MASEVGFWFLFCFLSVLGFEPGPLDLDSTCLSCSLFLNDSEEMKTVATLATREMADSRYNKE
jgi:hypothetical protein